MEEVKRRPGRPAGTQARKSKDEESRVTPLRFFVPKIGYERLQEISTLRGSSPSKEVRAVVVKLSEDELFALSQQPNISKNELIIPNPDEPKKNNVFYVQSQDKDKIEAVADRIEECGIDVKGRVSYPAIVVRLVVEHIIKTYKPSPLADVNPIKSAPEKGKRGKELFKNPDADKRGPWVGESIVETVGGKRRESEHKYVIVNPHTGEPYETPEFGWTLTESKMERRIKDKDIFFPEDGSLPLLKRFPVSNFTMRLGKPGVIERIAEFAAAAGITISDFYHLALMNFQGVSITKEAFKAEYPQACIRLKEEDRIRAEMLASQYLIKGKALTVADILRLAVYEEVERRDKA